MPSGKVDLPRIDDNRDGTVRIQYDPREEGIHELVVLHNGTPIQGIIPQCISPTVASVFDYLVFILRRLQDRRISFM